MNKKHIVVSRHEINFEDFDNKELSLLVDMLITEKHKMIIGGADKVVFNIEYNREGIKMYELIGKRLETDDEFNLREEASKIGMEIQHNQEYKLYLQLREKYADV